MGMIVLEGARSFLGLSLGLPGWQQGWAGGRGPAVRLHQVSGPSAAHVPPGFHRGWGWALRLLCRLRSNYMVPGLGSQPSWTAGIRLAQGMHPIFRVHSSLGRETPTTAKSSDAASAHPHEFSGIRCLDIKLSRCGCVGWAKIFLCRSDMQLMPLIQNLMWSRRYF